MNIGEYLKRMTFGRAVLIGMILGAFYYFFVFDSGTTQYALIESSKTQIQELERQIHENQIKLNRAAVYKQTVAEVGTTIQKLLAVLPENSTMNDIMKMISNEAKAAGSSVNNIAPGQPEIAKVAKEFEELPVHVDLTGTFAQHMVFLSNLTKLNQILTIKKFDFSSASASFKQDEILNIHFVADIVAYRYRGIAANETPKAAGK